MSTVINPTAPPDLSGYVPYTGATTNVNLGTKSLTAGSGSFSGTTDGLNQYCLTTWKTGTAGRNNFTASLGYVFTPYVSITVNQLGRYFSSGNSQDHKIEIWNAGTSTLVVSGTVLAASASDANGYKWVTVSNTVLSAGTVYVCLSYEYSGGDTWFDWWSSSGYFNSLYINRTGAAYGNQGSYPYYTDSGISVLSTPVFGFIPAATPQLTNTYTGGGSAYFITQSTGDTLINTSSESAAFSMSKLGIGRSGVTTGYALDIVGDEQHIGNTFFQKAGQSMGLWIHGNTQSRSPTNAQIMVRDGFLIIDSGSASLLLQYYNSLKPVTIGGGYLFNNVQLAIQISDSSNRGIHIRGQAGQTANYIDLQDSSLNYMLAVSSNGSLGINTNSPATKLHVYHSDAVTNAVTNISTIDHASSGTPTAGFGAGLSFLLQSSTTAAQSAGRMIYEWATATHASRKAQLRLTVNDFNAERDALTATTSGSAVTLTSGGKLSSIGGFAVLDATNDTTRQMNIEHDTYTTTFYRASNGGALAFGKSGATITSVDMTYVTGGITGLASMTLQTLNFAAVSAPSDTAAYISRPTTTEVRCYTSRGGSFWTWYVLWSSSNNTPWEAMRLDQTGILKIYTKHFTNNDITSALTLSHNLYSATVSSGYGQAIDFKLQSSTTADQNAGRLIYEWSDATHASRKARLRLTAYDTAEREGLRIEADGSYACSAFGGVVVASTTLSVYAPSSTYTPLIVKGASSQSASLFQIQNSSSASLVEVSSNGNLLLGGSPDNVSNGSGYLLAKLTQSGSVKGYIEYSSPGGFPGIIFFDPTRSSSKRYDIYYDHTRDSLILQRDDLPHQTGVIVGGFETTAPAAILDTRAQNDGTIFRAWGHQSGTADVGTVATINRTSTGTPTTGFGVRQLFAIEDSTTNHVSSSGIISEWVDATHATRKARLRLTAYDTSERDGVRIEADGSYAITAIDGVTLSSTACTIYAPVSTYKALVLKGASSQSANVLETQDSSGNILLSVTSNGNITFTGTSQAWDDVRVEPIARTTGANAPAFEQYFTDGSGSRGVYLYSFDDVVAASEKEVFFTMQMPHSWNGGDIHVHVHWIPAVSQNTATPRWGLEYTWVEPGGTFGNTTIVYATSNEQGDANLTANKHYITEFSPLTPSSSQDGLSSILICRLFRNSSNAADTYNTTGAKCGLIYIDAHYQIARIGSSSEYVA